MLHKFRLLLTTASTVILLLACTSETTEDASNEISSTDTAEVQTTETLGDENDSEDENKTEDADSTSEQTSEQTSNEETIEEVTEEKTEEETKTDDSMSEETVEESKDVQTEEITPADLDSDEQAALEKVLSVTGLNIEEHTYSFDQTEDYIEVEVREKTEDEATPLVGLFRYNPETKEVLVSDYLTGEFIPYENLD